MKRAMGTRRRADMPELYGDSFASLVTSPGTQKSGCAKICGLLSPFILLYCPPLLSILQNENGVFEVKGYGLERTQDIQPDDAVRVAELEVTDHNVPPE